MQFELSEDVVTALRGAAKSEVMRRLKRNQKPTTTSGVIDSNHRHIARLNTFLDHPQVKTTEYR